MPQGRAKAGMGNSKFKKCIPIDSGGQGRQTSTSILCNVYALEGQRFNYTPMEKLVLALLSASKRLKRYFQAHTIVVITNLPIKQLLSSSEISGRTLKWKFELEGYDIQYRPRTAIKGQFLADFLLWNGQRIESSGRAHDSRKGETYRSHGIDSQTDHLL
ncbi:reverse transcriptase domain-containing protein [Tanacetum coccineum]